MKIAERILDIIGKASRNTPYFRGKDFIARNFIKPIINRIDTEYVIPLKSGRMKIICRPVDWIPWTIYLYGSYIREEVEERMMLKAAEDCTTIIDVGANIGYYSIQFAETKNATIYAFEPMDYQHETLRRNLAINSISNVNTIKKIVSDQEGIERIYFSGFENTGKSSIVKKADQHEDIDAVTLDSFCEINNINNVDLIKIDVEGYEFKVLNGFHSMLESKKVTHVFVELLEKNLNKAGTSSREICDLLNKYDYRGYSIGVDGLMPYEIGSSESLVYFCSKGSVQELQAKE